jgi:membrane protein DedA with SNARE-associated domain/rhodanese-related sulfurtransferase
MGKLIPFITLHGPLIIFLVAFGNEYLPFPSELMFLQVGALVALGKFSLGWALVLPVAGTVLADVLLYFIGRHWGVSCLRLAYRFSLEPEAITHRKERLFGRYGLRFLLISKFFPMTMVPPVLAGMTRINLLRFLLYTTAGTLFWVALYTGVGYLFNHQIESIVRYASRATGALAMVGGVLFAGYVAFKLLRRRHILRRHHENRIDPENLKAILDAGHPVIIMDVRSRRAIEAFPFVIHGAIQIPVEELAQREQEIPVGKELVVYCSCTNDVASVRVALMLNEKGLNQVHPLSGGIGAWHARRYPVEKRVLPTAATSGGAAKGMTASARS